MEEVFKHLSGIRPERRNGHMGLIRAALKSAGGVLADQWKEYFYCEALDADTLVVKGQKRSGRRSAIKRGVTILFPTVLLLLWRTDSV